MTKIVVNFHPFTHYQDIFIYEDNKCIEEINISVPRVADAVQGLVKKYNTTNIVLCGNNSFLEYYKHEIQKQVNFEEEKELNIEIINK